jgi:hypothetical protein
LGGNRILGCRDSRHTCRGGGRSYSSALTKQVDTSSLFNGFVYRPLAIEPTTPGLRIAFTEGRYFDYLDQSEFLAHELGAQLLAGKAPLGGRYRSYISNPFDLEKRSTSLGINTLTIRKSAHEDHGFFMHRRGGRRVVNESELLHVVPAGEFAPSNIAPEGRPADFDIFRNILREYAEEFLNLPEADGRSGSELDFERDHPFDQLMEARKAGSLQISVLGIGLDSACWKPELLTVAIFEADVFDSAFDSLVTGNAEGVLLTGKGKRGFSSPKTTSVDMLQIPRSAPRGPHA